MGEVLVAKLQEEPDEMNLEHSVNKLLGIGRADFLLEAQVGESLLADKSGWVVHPEIDIFGVDGGLFQIRLSPDGFHQALGTRQSQSESVDAMAPVWNAEI